VVHSTPNNGNTAPVRTIDLTTLESICGKPPTSAWPVDASDFKTFIFPLLFFKRISDVYDEEYDQALQESAGHRLRPVCRKSPVSDTRGLHWRTFVPNTNLGQTIREPCGKSKK